MQTQLLIGKYGLDFLDDFYPDDIPKEWRFDYYSDFFSTLLLPIDTNEDIEEICNDAQNNDFQLVIEINNEHLQDIDKLKKLLSSIYNYKECVILWFELELDNVIYKLVSDFKIVMQLSNKINNTNLKHKKILNYNIYFNDTPVIVSSLSLEDKEIREFLDKIAKIKQKVIVICRLAESYSLNKAITISELLGY